jgi:hypothetical protein
MRFTAILAIGIITTGAVLGTAMQAQARPSGYEVPVLGTQASAPGLSGGPGNPGALGSNWPPLIASVAGPSDERNNTGAAVPSPTAGAVATQSPSGARNTDTSTPADLLWFVYTESTDNADAGCLQCGNKPGFAGNSTPASSAPLFVTMLGVGLAGIVFIRRLGTA